MKKIGICTLNDACNMGAILQAFAMQEVIKKMGHDVEFLNLKNCIIHDEERITEEFINMRKCLNKADHYYDPKTDKYDAIIVGSDEIWNVEEPSFEHIDEFLGYNLNAPKIIAYAPGANKTNGKKFKQYYKGKDLSNFTSLSARDTNAQNIIKEVAGIDAPIVLDPTFLIYSYDRYLQECSEEDYILIYGWDFKEETKKAIIKFARERNLKLYCAGYEYNLEWTDKFIGSNIFEFLKYMKNAAYVVTSETFHGLIFSMLFNKQFITMTHGRFKSRELIERAGLEDRDCLEETQEEITKKLEKRINFIKFRKWLIQEKEKSINYLEKAI